MLCNHVTTTVNWAYEVYSSLTHWSRVTHKGVSKLDIIGSDNGLSPGRHKSHFLNQCLNIVILTLGNNLHGNLYPTFTFKKCICRQDIGRRFFWASMRWSCKQEQPKTDQCNFVAAHCGVVQPHAITETSSWAQLRTKSPALRLFIQPFVQVQFKENIKAPRHWPLGKEFTGHWPPQNASNAQNVSI